MLQSWHVSIYFSPFPARWPFDSNCINVVHELHTRVRKELITTDKIALLLVIIGALNWLLVGLFQFDLVAAIFGGQQSWLSRVVYSLVGLAGLWSIKMLFSDQRSLVSHPAMKHTPDNDDDKQNQ